MDKSKTRYEFFKLKNKGYSYSQCRRILLTKFGYSITVRTLQRWIHRLDKDNSWDLTDKSRKPKTIHRKITEDNKAKILEIRNKTGWGENKISDEIGIGHTTVNKILRQSKLINPPKKKKKRAKYIRFQRDHPNIMWQIDHSDQKVKDKWLISVIDDCSRFSLGLFAVNSVTTEVVTKLLDDLIKKYGKPEQILSDNGSAYGLRSKHSKFDRWCRRRGILHIRSGVHSPTTCGKVERLFQTIQNELQFSNNNLELFRMRYNHFRRHASLNKKTPSDIYFASDICQ
jgi:transposase InsO family protein